MSETSEVDATVRRMKLAAYATAYHRKLVELINPDHLLAPDSPVFPGRVTTTSVRVAVKAAARQGYDVGRFTSGPGTSCPYPEMDAPTTTALRMAWFIGFGAGRKVAPRPDPRPIEHHPVEFRPPRWEGPWPPEDA